MTAVSERILEARAVVKKVRGYRKSRMRRRRLRHAERRLAMLQGGLERGAKEVIKGAIPSTVRCSNIYMGLLYSDVLVWCHTVRALQDVALVARNEQRRGEWEMGLA